MKITSERALTILLHLKFFFGMGPPKVCQPPKDFFLNLMDPVEKPLYRTKINVLITYTVLPSVTKVYTPFVLIYLDR